MGVVAVSVTLACWALLGLPQRYPVWAGGGWARVMPIPARRVVVQPWFGPHHVYGVFFVPEEYDGRDYVVTVAHDGDRRVIERGVLDLSSGEFGQFVRAYASTRFALWTMLEGSGSQLRRADDWILLVRTDQVE